MSNASPAARSQFTDLNLLPLSLQMGSFRADFVNWGFIEPRWWRNYLHIHSFFEVCYAFQGRGTFRIAEQDFPVQSGEVFIAKPGEPHEILSSEDDPLGIYFWSYTLSPLNETFPDEKSSNPFLLAFLSSSRYVSRHTTAMQRTLELLTEEIVQKEPGYMQSIVGLTTKLLLDTTRSIVDSSSFVENIEPPPRSQEEAIAQMIVRYLRDNYNRHLSLRDVAAQVHLSERHSSRLFRNVMGVSIMDYLTSLRLEHATRLLIEQQRSIKQIAQDCGYSDVRHFITLFHRRMGVTPGVFRLERGTRFLSSGRHTSK